MKIRPIVFLVGFLLSTICHPAVAMRITKTIPISLLSRFSYERNAFGESLPDGPSKTEFGNPQRIGGMLLYELTLMNLSSVKQTGTIEVIPSSVIAEARCANRGIPKYFNIGLYLCGETKDSSGVVFAEARTPESALPAPIQFSLTGDETSVFRYDQLFWSTYGNPPSGCPSAYVRGIVAFKITVNEDRGALLGSVTPRTGSHSPSVSAGGSFKHCGVGQDFQVHFSGDYPDSPAVPVMLNGGRPF